MVLELPSVSMLGGASTCIVGALEVGCAKPIGCLVNYCVVLLTLDTGLDLTLDGVGLSAVWLA